jgi:hypothetical protein
MIGYDFVSTTGKVLVDNEELAILSLLKVQSSPCGKPQGISDEIDKC